MSNFEEWWKDGPIEWQDEYDRHYMMLQTAYRAGQEEMRERTASFFIDFIKHYPREHLISADFLTLPVDGDTDGAN